MDKENTHSQDKNYNISAISNSVSRMVEVSFLRLCLDQIPIYKEIPSSLEKFWSMKENGLTEKKTGKVNTIMIKTRHISIMDHGLMMRDMVPREPTQAQFMSILANGSMAKCQAKEF